MHIRRLSPLGNETHIHDEHCGCGHQHVPSDQQLQAGGDLRTQVAIVLAMGLRPCSGAIMVLLFAKVIGVYSWGVISAITMAVGTSLTVSLIGVLVFYSRALAVKLSATRTPAAWQTDHLVAAGADRRDCAAGGGYIALQHRWRRCLPDNRRSLQGVNGRHKKTDARWDVRFF